MSASTYKYNLLKILHDTRPRLTATDFSYVSNANQYFFELENQDLITSEWKKKGNTRVKLSYVAEHQRELAKKYLDNMGDDPQQDEIQES